jgi:ATP-dependent DNA helicase RecG
MGSMVQMRVYDDKLNIWNEGLLPDGMDLESLKHHHISRPRNPLIADVCFKAGYIDSWGRGTLKIYEACKEAGLPEPEITNLDGGILVTVFKKETSSLNDQASTIAGSQVNDLEKSIEQVRREFGLLSDRIALGKEKNIAFLRGNYGVFTGYLRGEFGRNSEEIRKKFGENALFVLELISIKPDLTRQNIADLLGISLSTIEKNSKKLRDATIIEREGTDKIGHWKIIEQK